MSSDKAKAFPTKKFFMRMQTRDIEFKEAILDLIDNCIDGTLRENKEKGVKDDDPQKYKGYYCRITIDEASFSIEDNCGGIPRDTAVNYAFRMGRDDDDGRDDDIAAVGIYGIGMKRAIFKMGDSGIVLTQHQNKAYKVEIPERWGEDKENWEFPITDMPNDDSLPENGTRVTISKLHASTVREFSGISLFLDELTEEITTHFVFIMEKGFKIVLNEKELIPVKMKIHYGEKIKPYVYKATIDGVDVSLSVGLRGSVPTTEDEEEDRDHANKSAHAGWTVVCNDRVVLYNDKTRVTGWGDAAPQYHSKFMCISGLVEFRSKNAEMLPLRTSKRGVDANSYLYNYVRNFMMTGTRIFTRHTNMWKKNVRKHKTLFKDTSTLEFKDSIDKVFEEEKDKIKKPRNNYSKNKDVVQKLYIPDLPKYQDDKNRKVMRFSRPAKDIEKVSEYLFEDPNIPPSEVSKQCFDKILEYLETD